jgi:curved DNA-binding protein CbpA
VNKSIDHYSILGVSPSADPDVIKAAYRTLAKKMHPDGGGHVGTSTEFAKVAEAYSVLSDSEQKAKYDALRAAAVKLRKESRSSVRRASNRKAHIRAALQDRQVRTIKVILAMVVFVIAVVAIGYILMK